MIFANQALLSTGWANDVRLTLDGGRIGQIETGACVQAGDTRVDTLLPALGNLHSHTFQRAMAGMTEARKAGRDSFWTWRDLMYRFMDRLTPEQIEAIAALVFMEMQEAGYASVGEFHYVHNQRGGTPYNTQAELSLRIMGAAAQTGIGLTHLPVLYTYGGAGKAPLHDGQLRFGNTVEQFSTLVEGARTGLSDMPDDTRIGIAPHSLRATSPQDLASVLATHPNVPVHIHISEQPQEVTDIKGWLGARPVEWLLAHNDVGPDWCLIHATHMTADETRNMAATGAVAGLCPITEANLGDGPFNGPQYLEAGGTFGIGSDSNVNISLTEELRALEYSQRLRDLARNVMVVGEGSVGHTLYTGTARGGAQALGRDAGEIAVGKLADLTAIDTQAAALCALTQDQILDGLVFAAKDNIVTDQWSAGRHCVKGGRHIARDAITSHYRHAVSELLASL
jgi:formiminoglutamate deiminase